LDGYFIKNSLGGKTNLSGKLGAYRTYIRGTSPLKSVFFHKQGKAVLPNGSCTGRMCRKRLPDAVI
jgi:hypothetical protein